MNTCKTIGSLKADVFRVLDEYSRNGNGYDFYSGGTGDMDKRFLTALNGALCLIDSAVGSGITKAKISFSRPRRLAQICNFDIFGSEKKIEVPFFAGSVSFEFMGEGKLSFCDVDGKVIEERQLSSGYGNFEVSRAFVPTDAFGMIFSSEKSLLVRGLLVFDKQSLCGCTDEKFLPDGKKLYCEISHLCHELVSAKNSKKYDIPCDIFGVKDGVIFCDEEYEGDYFVEYTEYPESYDESDSYDTPLTLSPSIYEAVVFAVASSICEREDGELYSRLTYKYREMLANIYPKHNLKRKNSFFSGGFFGRRRRGYSFRA